MKSRALQNTILRALCDSEFRRTADLTGIDAGGLGRFAAFLVRHYYHERVVHYFKYSRALGKDAVPVIDGPRITPIIPRAALGSLETAKEIGAIIVDYLLQADDGIIPYWRDLIRYETAFFIADARLPENRNPDVVDFEWNLPPILPRLLHPWDTLPMPERQATPLIFWRSPHGEVSAGRLKEKS